MGIVFPGISYLALRCIFVGKLAMSGSSDKVECMLPNWLQN